MYKIFILIFIIINLLNTESYGENKHKMDSLKMELQKSISDTTKLRIYIALCKECPINDNLLYAIPAEKLANKLLEKKTNTNEKRHILTCKAEIYEYFDAYYQSSDKPDVKKALKYSEKSLELFSLAGEKIKAAESYQRNGRIYYNLGNTPKCIEYYHKGLKIADSLSKIYRQKVDTIIVLNEIRYSIYYQLAYLHASLNDTSAALEFNGELKKIAESGIKEARKTGNLNSLKEAKMQLAGAYWNIEQLMQKSNQLKALEACDKILSIYREIKDTIQLAAAYNLKALIYQDKKEFSTALKFFNIGLELFKKKKDDGGMGMILGNLGYTYELQKEFVTAIEYYNKCINLKRTYMYNDLGRVYYKMKNYKMAELFWNKHYNNVKQDGFPRSIGTAAQSLSDLYRKINKFEKSLIMYEVFIKMKDSTNNQELQKSIIQKKYQYEYEKKQIIDKEAQAKKEALAKAESKKQEVIILFIAFGLLFVLAFTGFIFRSLRIANKQKRIIEEKNREITDSIEYALRIQTAILPPHKIIKQYLENSFILYKPKDIVAGDFYWMESIGDVVLFAACDCTGHGVPGAMVSVVCHNALNRAVREFSLTKPASILDKTAAIVLENFSKSEEEIQDGMDISICALNTKTKTLEWAGANNSLLLIKNGQLTETKADKQCIGYNDNVKPFTNHLFNLQPDTSIYLFTDGYADQFGGQRERKLTKSKFKELLVSIQNLPIQQQATELDEFITNYKKETEQTDDILVICVKV